MMVMVVMEDGVLFLSSSFLSLLFGLLFLSISQLMFSPFLSRALLVVVLLLLCLFLEKLSPPSLPPSPPSLPP
jgi:hypothetical protein